MFPGHTAAPDPDAPLHPIVEAAGGRPGELPAWARVSPARRAHVERVTALLDEWADGLGLDERQRVRWRASGRLHDALKSADVEALRMMAGRDLPESVLHGPACAVRLRDHGVRDEELLLGIAFHSIGHPALSGIGEYLYLADFLEPGRKRLVQRREKLRARMPEDLAGVLREVAGLRIRHVVDAGLPLLRESAEFWNRLLEDGE